MKIFRLLLVPLALSMSLYGKDNCPTDYQNKKLDIDSIASLPMFVPLISLKSSGGQITMVKWSPDNKHIATVSEDNFVRIWEAGPATLVNVIGHLDTITSIEWAQDGTRLAIAAGDEVRIALLDFAFAAEKELAQLTAEQPEQLAFVNAIISSTDTVKLTASQQAQLDTLPQQVRWGVERKVEMNQALAQRKKQAKN